MSGAAPLRRKQRGARSPAPAERRLFSPPGPRHARALDLLWRPSGSSCLDICRDRPELRVLGSRRDLRPSGSVGPPGARTSSAEAPARPRRDLEGGRRNCMREAQARDREPATGGADWPAELHVLMGARRSSSPRRGSPLDHRRCRTARLAWRVPACVLPGVMRAAGVSRNRDRAGVPSLGLAEPLGLETFALGLESPGRNQALRDRASTRFRRTEARLLKLSRGSRAQAIAKMTFHTLTVRARTSGKVRGEQVAAPPFEVEGHKKRRPRRDPAWLWPGPGRPSSAESGGAV